MDSYHVLEAMGALHVFSASEDGTLIGFVTVATPPSLHFSIPVAVAESIFVTEPRRSTGAGLRLLAAAEDQARALGSPILLVCAPMGGKLIEVLPRRGYTETNRVFVKELDRCLN